MLAACGKTVLISDYFEYYRLAAYLARYTKKKIGITMGAASLVELFDEKYYAQLDGGILESFGRLFKNDLKLYIYPLLDRADRQIDHGRKPASGPELRKLYEYLVEKGCIEQLDNYNPAYLPIFSRDVIEQIKSGNPAWSDHVPSEVAEVIRRRGFFGYRKPVRQRCAGQARDGGQSGGEVLPFPDRSGLMQQNGVRKCWKSAAENYRQWGKAESWPKRFRLSAVVAMCLPTCEFLIRSNIWRNRNWRPRF